MPSDAPPDRRALAFGLAAIAGLTVWRIALLPFYGGDLFVDDAQYWLWAQTLAWGYYSKPPLIAWVLAVSTGIGSDGAFWIRLPLPMIHAATALAVLWTGRALWGDRVGALAGAFFASAPAVAWGSLLVSTDTPMLLFFALALRAHLALILGGGARWAILLGVALGLGLLSKYAMSYFLLCAAVAAVFLPQARMPPRHAALAVGIGLAVLAPNLWWNANNGFATVQHTAANAGWEGPRLDVVALLGFWASQFAISGPAVFAAYLARLARPAGFDARYLAAMSLPTLAVVSAQALAAGANANWAAAAHPAAILLGAATLAPRPRLLALGLGINLFVSLAVPVAATRAETLRLGGELVFERYLGRAETSRIAAAVAAEQGLDTIVARDRSILADMFHTLRDSGLAIYAEPPAGFPPHHYAQAHALPAGEGTALYVGRRAPDCATGAPAPVLIARRERTGGNSDRPLLAWRVDRSCWSRATGR